MTASTGKERLSEEQLEYYHEAFNADTNPVTYLSIDPGKANGCCGYNEKHHLMFMMTVQADDMAQYLNQFEKVKKCILEDFMLYPDKSKQQVYSDMETSRVIGRVESWAELKRVELIKQPARIKPTGYLWSGQKPLPKSNPRNHERDAHIHFVYWAVKNGRIKAEDLL